MAQFKLNYQTAHFADSLRLSYEAEKDEIVDLFHQDQYICTAMNGYAIKDNYIKRRQIECN